MEKILERRKQIEEEINKIQHKENELRNELKKLKKECQHPKENLKINNWGTAECLICGKNFHWYCPTSPTLECDYEQEDGDYDEDHCRYCGQPEERK